MVLCVGTTPAVQRVMVFTSLALNEVNRATMVLEGAAGKSINVAKVLRQLGEQPVAIGFLGGDSGKAIEAALAAMRIEMEFVPVAAPTRLCITAIDQTIHTQTELVQEGPPVSCEAFESLVEVFRRRVAGARAVVMSGTLAPGCPVDSYLRWTHAAHQAGALAAIDAQGSALEHALGARPGLVKPNRSELSATLRRPLESERELQAGMAELHERGAQRVIVTAGKSPALAFDGRRYWRVTSPSIRAVNPIGSGDSFTAAVVARLLQGDELGEACRWGSAAGAANALTLMPGELALDEVHRLLKQAQAETV